LDAETRTMIAAGDPKQLRDQSDDPRVRRFLTRGENGDTEMEGGVTR
ncbi:MAG TPA: polyamine ABC transporter ATP-binding protein, partial [Geoalkalibacter subterraneus]|nr:polyamine ABC transporter ATP-binding protein [Geoalkalibacter subterraneus]